MEFLSTNPAITLVFAIEVDFFTLYFTETVTTFSLRYVWLNL